MVVLERAREEVQRANGGNLTIGIAAFPEDGADLEELCAEAEHALSFARDSGLGMVSRMLLT
jgi:hypothetical protein